MKMVSSDGYVVDVTQGEADAMAAAGWKPMEATPAQAQEGARRELTVAEPPRTVEGRASQWARENPGMVGPLEAAFPRLMQWQREEPGTVNLWSGIKDVASLPGRILATSSAEGMADPEGRTFLRGVAKDPLTLVTGAAGGGLAGALRTVALLQGAKAADRATASGATAGDAVPEAPDVVLDAALAAAPLGLGRLGRTVGGKASAAARDAAGEAFMQMMKFLPGERNRSVWEAGRRFAMNPEMRRELVAGASDVQDVVNNFVRMREAESAAHRAAVDALDQSGQRIDMRRVANAAAEAARRAPTDPRTREEAALWARQHLLVPDEGAIYAHPTQPQFVHGEQILDFSPRTLGVPLNAVEERLPSDAIRMRARAARNIRWDDPGASSAQDEAMVGAYRDVAQQLEAIDPRIADVNARIAPFLAANKGFMRAESRAANRSPRGPWQRYLYGAEATPARVRALDIASKAAGQFAGAAEGGGRATAAGVMGGISQAEQQRIRKALNALSPEAKRAAGLLDLREAP